MDDRMKTLLILCLVVATSCLKIGPEEYLVKYGYISSQHTFSDVDLAVRRFQKFAHIPETGMLDDVTVATMQMPRCGVPDFTADHRAKRFVASSSYWLNRTVTFAFENFNADLGEVNTRRIIKAAFKAWSDVTNLVFIETPGTKATIMIRFGSGGHRCNYPFDGKGGVLAHAFYPDHGQVHFDEDEFYTENTSTGTNLFWVAAHEFGHALGLPHSDVYEALMYPFYKGYKANFKLPLDDTGAIQALYGCKNTAYTPLPIPQDAYPFSGMLLHRWQNAEGDAMHHIQPHVCRYPHNPDQISILTKFEAPKNYGEKIATRIEGYFEATQTGYYHFELCADHSAKLFVSSSSNPADKEEIVKVEQPTGQDYSKCKSAYGSYFRAGNKYYIEAVHKESSGDDYITVRASEPNGQKRLITDSEMQWALADTDIRVIVCKGRYEALACPNGYAIEIVKAAYGYSTSSSFSDKVKRLCNNQRSYSGSDCSAPSSNRIVTSLCQGKQQCLLYAHDTEFLDKCSRWSYSVLDVTYKCVQQGKQTLPPVTQAPTTTAPTSTASTKSPGSCSDKSNESDCKTWKSWGHCSYRHVREYYCPKTCGHCI